MVARTPAAAGAFSAFPMPDGMASAVLPNPSPLDRAELDHTPCYCEENVWHLCQRLASTTRGGIDSVFAVFISNPAKQVPLWRQRAGRDASAFVCWDYHVLVIDKRGADALVLDLDSMLPFPCTLEQYKQEALLPLEVTARLPSQTRRRFRVVAAHQFLQHFGSDRGHMRQPDGSYSSPPPPWPCIVGQSGRHTLPQYWSMEAAEPTLPLAELQRLPFGAVYDEPDFLRSFGCA